jgi:calcineurin-like phosphoesterase family protein
MASTDKPSNPSGLLTYAIGDIHGCVDKLKRLLERCSRYGGDRPARYVFLGDYVDRGPDSRAVVQLLRAEERNKPDQMICLRGNHDAMMVDAVTSDDYAVWLLNGAVATLTSYGVNHPANLPRHHVDWLASRPLSFDDGQRFFVHAGINPDVPLDQQLEQDQLWIREPFLSNPRNYGRLIVHGHTPLETGLPDLRRNRLNLDTAAVFGGPLTAAVFNDEKTWPVAFLTDIEASTPFRIHG